MTDFHLLSNFASEYLRGGMVLLDLLFGDCFDHQSSASIVILIGSVSQKLGWWAIRISSI